VLTGIAAEQARQSEQSGPSDNRRRHGEAETLTPKAIELAKAGDLTALRLCLERIAPVRRDRPVLFDMLELTCAADAIKASAALMISIGDLTPTEAAELGKLVEAYVRSLEATDLSERLLRLEERAAHR
jgi:hypothetical protein